MVGTGMHYDNPFAGLGIIPAIQLLQWMNGRTLQCLARRSIKPGAMATALEYIAIRFAYSASGMGADSRKGNYLIVVPV
jgi:hypothetical protein